MDVVGDILTLALGGLLALVVALLCLLIWGSTLSAWRESGTRPEPHDPAWYFSLRMWSWERSPESLHDWMTGGLLPDDDARPDGVVVGETIAALDGTTTDGDTSAIPVELRVALPDGTETLIHADGEDATSLRSGTYLPVQRVPEHVTDLRGDTWQLAFRLPAGVVAEVLLEHRHRLGLIEEEAMPALLAGRPETVDLLDLRPTGRARAGHVEVEARLATDLEPTTVTGFLRAEDVATARHTGQACATRTPEERWLLWPTWQ